MKAQVSSLSIKTLASESVPTEVFGGKASQLNQLSREQIAVPPALFLSVDWWKEVVRDKQWRSPFTFETISECFSDINSLPSLLEPLLQTSLIATFFSDDTQLAAKDENESKSNCQRVIHLAVRSSSVAEDSEAASFAGVHDTILNVCFDGQNTLPVWKAIAKVWASGFSSRARLYREAMGEGFCMMNHAASINNVEMGVVIQKMVDAKVAGVLFTQSPVSSSNNSNNNNSSRVSGGNEMLLNAAEGLGEGVVSGQVEPDHILISKKLPHVILSQRIRKGFATPALTREQIDMLLMCADKIVENRENTPQDIEFAWDGTTMWILQTRAITTLGEQQQQQQQRRQQHVLTNDMTKDVTPYAVTAMTWTAFSTIITTALQKRYKSAGINYEWEEDKGFYQLARGRIYQSFDVMAGLCRAEFGVALEEVAKTFPSLTPSLIKQAFPTSSLSPSVPLSEHMGGMWRVLTKLKSSHSLCEQLEQQIAAHTKWCVENDDEKTFALFSSSDAATNGSFSSSTSMSSEHAMVLFEKGFERIVEFGAMYMNLQIVLSIFTSVVRMGLYTCKPAAFSTSSLSPFSSSSPSANTNASSSSPPSSTSASSNLTHEQVNELLASLLVGLGGVITAEQDESLLQLAHAIGKEEKVARFFEQRVKSADASKWQGWEGELKDTQFSKELQHFLSLYGFRCVNELEVAQARWREDPTFILNILQLFYSNGIFLGHAGNSSDLPTRSNNNNQDKNNHLASTAAAVSDNNTAPHSSNSSNSTGVKPRMNFAQLEAQRKAAESYVLKNTALLKRPLMSWAIERFQRMVRLRENSKAVIVRYIAFMRRCLLCLEPHLSSILLPSSTSFAALSESKALATDESYNRNGQENSSSENKQQLCLKSRVEQPIFHLCMNDVRLLVKSLPLEGEALVLAAENVQTAIRVNSARKARWERLSAPSVLIHGRAPEQERVAVSSEGDLLGLAASPGVARGQCCVLLSPEDSHLMVLGGVLVAPITDPAWTPIFLLASAVVVEHAGGVLSHASIVARELGIPAVLGVNGAVDGLRGTEVTVDGSKGRVTRH